MAGQNNTGQQGQRSKKPQAVSPAQKKASAHQGQGNKKTKAVSQDGQKGSDDQGRGDSKPQGMTDEQQKREAAAAAQKAQEYKRAANYYLQAASGAGDPDERQKLMEKYMDENIKAEKFGKTAKYLNTGGGQGFAAGAGLGVGLGVVLGTLTGTLVGGPTSLLTGGIGAAAGWIHGPFFNLAGAVGGTIRKITGDLPGWKATTEQKRAIEKMCGQIEDTEVPTAEELEGISGSDAAQASQAVSSAKNSNNSWVSSAASYIPSFTEESNAEKQQRLDASKKNEDAKSKLQGASDDQAKVQNQGPTQGKGTSSPDTKQPSNSGQDVKQSNPSGPPKTPSNTTGQSSPSGQKARSQPRKLGKPSAANEKQPTPARTTTHGSDSASKAQDKPLTSTNCDAAKRDTSTAPNGERKKPRKLEPRSTGTSSTKPAQAGSQSQTTGTPRRSPRKLESRA